MRTSLLLLAVLSFASFSSAQDDPGIQAIAAAQQASMQAMQANQQAIADMQRANQEANDDMMREMQANASVDVPQNNGPVVALTATPKISVKSGHYPGPVTIKLSDRSRGAIMYYRTDGWTPTTRSKRYTGPFTISQSATLQVIAVAPYCIRSLVATATYTLPPPPAPPANAPTSSSALDQPYDNVVPVHFFFAQEVTSAKAEIGDKVPLTLADDLVFNGATLARKGAPASVSIIQVDKTGPGGAPGELHFCIDPMQTDTGLLKLHGAASLEGQAEPPNAAVMIPVVGAFAIFHHGKDAIIKPGTLFTAYLDASSLVAFNTN
ncbi:MAG TPA: chitobiase/beta-hexosaminidase C-terminal domain-containing protein [Candidatus Acidoferrum sp.]|nr:chitobiase/beta-hexosaminidase C-terminal domain-containing protein [Candidatus Acidoferrum sp.]